MRVRRERAGAPYTRTPTLPMWNSTAILCALYLFTVNNHSFCCTREMPATSFAPVVSTAL